MTNARPRVPAGKGRGPQAVGTHTLWRARPGPNTRRGPGQNVHVKMRPAPNSMSFKAVEYQGATGGKTERRAGLADSVWKAWEPSR